MYETIYVPVDNSDHSNRAIKTSLDLGRSFDAKLVGCHVYAAQMHDYRFKQMEFTLPEEYLQEQELERQRKIHDSLITMGLELISDCYLTDMEKLCQAQGLPFEKKMMDGKHSTEILKDMEQSDYDLVVLGALGIGRTRDAQIGSVCQRVAKQSDRDVWVVKHLPKKGEPVRDTIMVGVDGSPDSFGALMTSIELAKRFDKKIELVSVYDPYLHYAVFKGIVDVLTERAAKVFRFEEQNQLHEEIIDTGLAEIYQSHLNVAEKMARAEGLEVGKTLLDGKAFQKVLDHARKVEPWLLVIGRVGVHKNDADGGLGSNTENLLRLSECDILLTTSEVTPEIDLQAEESIHWTPEAEERMHGVPDMVKGIARTGILRLALEKGHSVVSSDLIDEAMDRFMPKSVKKQTEQLAEALAFEKARERSVWVCKKCATVASVENPAQCRACNASDFEVLAPEVIDQIEKAEGGAAEETTYDGRKLRWTKESRKALRTLTDAYQRRRAKARIEKSARTKKLTVVTMEFARRFVEEEGGVLYETTPESAAAEATEVAERDAATAAAQDAEDAGRKLIARDEAKTPLFSTFDWTPEAITRVMSVPRGFMRDRTQERVETLATEQSATMIDLPLVEAGVEVGLQMMADLLETYGEDAALAATASAASSAPVEKVQQVAAQASATARAGKCPFSQASSAQALNEVGVMAELDKKREEMGIVEPS